MSGGTNPEVIRALIVDDEAAIRRLVMMSLVKEGFAFDTAEDGETAANLVASKSYDLVITDLVLPGKNGHSLTVDLLAKPDRPLIVVVTGVLEPRLAKDLLARGIEDIRTQDEITSQIGFGKT
jgi:DNA-binding response OmpR family regulator